MNPMDLQMLWTAEYESSRYLREVHPAALAERYGNLIQNLWSTDSEGKVQAVRDPNRGTEILRLLFTSFWSKLHAVSGPRISFSTNGQ